MILTVSAIAMILAAALSAKNSNYMNYIKLLSPVQLNNIKFIVSRMKQKGITNDITIAAILAVLSKESAFIPQTEKDYSGTSIDRIRQIFRSAVQGLSDAAINELKKDPVKFFNYIYGNRGGNGPDEGYKYRGRGLNQITFKNNYKAASDDTGVDLVKNPERLNELSIATDALIGFYKRSFRRAETTPIKLKSSDNSATVNFYRHYNTNGINGFVNLSDAVKACYHMNAGLGRSIEYINADHTGGLKKSMLRAPAFLQLVKSIA